MKFPQFPFVLDHHVGGSIDWLGSIYWTGCEYLWAAAAVSILLHVLLADKPFHPKDEPFWWFGVVMGLIISSVGAWCAVFFWPLAVLLGLVAGLRQGAQWLKHSHHLPRFKLVGKKDYETILAENERLERELGIGQ